MTRKSEPKPIFDSEEERAEFEFHESDGWVSVENFEEQRRRLELAARQMLEGNRRRSISISISERDLARLKTRAAEKGVPYETLIDSILHDYAEA
jgi:predicted DNA binding CopG/RHH family protein